LTSILALPIGVGGVFLAGPIINFLFGADYANSVLPLQILSWSAVLVILRGTFRQSLNAAGRQNLDLRCAGASITLNVSLNLLLIPVYGIIGAAITTLLAEILWLSMAAYYFYRYITPINMLPFLLRPILAAGGMAICFWFIQPWFWMVQGVVGVLVYFGMLYLLQETEVRSWVAKGYVLIQGRVS
jgi:O-antigen/teichoic acid export membrane protein